MRTLHLALLAAAACRPSAAVEPTRPEIREPVVSVVAAPVAAPTPTPAPQPEPPPTWEWALSVLPELAEHHEADPGAVAHARFIRWFDGDAQTRVYVLLEQTCHAISGSASDDGFHGRWRRQVTTEGDQRTDSAMAFDITEGGISESGPGGLIYQRDGRGRWQEAGGFGTGHFHTLVEHAMSAADDHTVTFAGYTYTLEPACGSTETITQTCSTGGQRVCRRCTRVSLRQHTEHMLSGSGSVGIGRIEPAPADCAQACPADEWTDLLPRLATVLQGRRFTGVLADEGPTVFRDRQRCARESRRRKLAAAAARKAEAAAESQ